MVAIFNQVTGNLTEKKSTFTPDLFTSIFIITNNTSKWKSDQ